MMRSLGVCLGIISILLIVIAHVTSHIPERHEKRVIWYGWYSNKSRGMRKKQAAANGEGAVLSQAEIVAQTEERAPLNVRRAWAYLAVCMRSILSSAPTAAARCR